MVGTTDTPRRTAPAAPYQVRRATLPARVSSRPPRTAAICLLALALTAPPGAARQAPAGPGAGGTSPDVPFDVHEATIPQLGEAMASGRVTAVQLVDAYLARIAAYDRAGPRLNAMIRLNPAARDDAARLDEERRAGRVRGPLHGVPVVLKDNYDTSDMPTAASSVALAGLVPPDDGFQVRRLREAGAVILGKTNMHELASGITTISSLGGQTLNPYDPLRNPGGSSGGSGVAAAASYAALAWGSDTCGSIRIPAAFHNLFGLRPTKGLSSIDGIVPLSHTQDVGGPLARTVTDLALGLDATVGADPADSATRILEGGAPPSFADALGEPVLAGARLGILTGYFGDQPEDREVASVVEAAVEALRRHGAETLDVELGDIDRLVGGAGVIDLEFKFDLADYLAATPGAPVATLTEILDRGLHHAALEASFRRRDTVATRDSDAYRTALARQDSARRAVIRLMDEEGVDALVYPTTRRKPAVIGEPQRGSTCSLSAVTGLPALAMPAGFTDDGLPVGVELLGRPLADARLLALAWEYERATRPRRPPVTTPPLVGGFAPPPQPFTAEAGGVRVAFSWDPTRTRLDYHVRAAGAAPEDVRAVLLERVEGGRNGPVLHHLAGPGLPGGEVRGTLLLDETGRADLRSGRLHLGVYTTDAPLGAGRAPLALPSTTPPSPPEPGDPR